MKKATLLIIFLFFSNVAYPREKSTLAEEKLKECQDLSSYRLMAGCYSSLYLETERYLNKEYQKLIDYLKEPDKKNLVAAQRAWIEFRDKDCYFSTPKEEEFEPYYKNMESAACKFNHTLLRLKQIEKYNRSAGCNGCAW